MYTQFSELPPEKRREVVWAVYDAVPDARTAVEQAKIDFQRQLLEAGRRNAVDRPGGNDGG